MSQPTLSAVISANATGFYKTLGELQSKLKSFENGLSTAKSAESFARLQRAADETKRRIDSLRNSATQLNAGFRPTSQVTGQATMSLANMGRVVQDLPFGFLGIANNLNPLLESFQRLRATSGSNVQAFKALGSSLLGAGGIGFALSVVSSLFLVMGNNMSASAKKAKEMKDRVQELADELPKIADNAAAGTAGEAAIVGALVGVIDDQTNSYDKRNNALKELQRINKNYFGDLTLEASKLQLLKERAEEYTQAIIAQAVVKGFEDQIGKVAVAISDQTRAFNEAEKQVTSLDKALQKSIKSGGAVNVNPGFVSNEATAIEKQRRKSVTSLLKEGEQLSKLRGQYDQLQVSIKDAVQASLGFKPLTGGADPKKEGDDIIAQAKRISDFIKENTAFDLPFDVNPFDSKAETQRKARAFVDAATSFIKGEGAGKIRELKLKFSIQPEFVAGFDLPGIQKAFTDTLKARTISIAPPVTLNAEEITKNFTSSLDRQAEKIFTAIQERLKAFTRQKTLELGGAVSINSRFDGMNMQEKASTALADINEQFIQLVGNFQQNIFDAIGNGIGTALSGGGFGSLFKGIFSALGSALQQLGQSLIAASIGIQQLKALFKPPFNFTKGLAAGIGLIAIGGLIKSSFGSIKGLATGGPMGAGKTYLVGERGPELFQSNLGGRIIPNSQLGGSSLSMGAQMIIVAGELRGEGDSIVAVINSVNRRQGRTT